MPTSSNRYPKTPEGLAMKARNETKNAQPVGQAIRPHSELFTKEQFLEDATTYTNTEKKMSAKKTRGEKHTKNNLQNMAQQLLQYSLKEDSLDVHGFLRNIGISPRTLFELASKHSNLNDAYEKAKSNFAYNNHNLLLARKKYNIVALNKSAQLHGVYSDPLRAERRKDKEFERVLDIKIHQQIQEERKNNPLPLPEVKVHVVYE